MIGEYLDRAESLKEMNRFGASFSPAQWRLILESVQNSLALKLQCSPEKALDLTSGTPGRRAVRPSDRTPIGHQSRDAAVRAAAAAIACSRGRQPTECVATRIPSRESGGSKRLRGLMLLSLSPLSRLWRVVRAASAGLRLRLHAGAAFAAELGVGWHL